MAAGVTERLVDVLEAWEAPIWEESHGMVQPENIDSGHSNFQLDTRSSTTLADFERHGIPKSVFL